MKKRNYTFEEVAKELGISVEELTEVAKNEGLINEEGSPTEFALENELLEYEQIDIPDNNIPENFIRPSQLYEWTINNLKDLPEEEQSRTIENLKSLNWIPSMLDELSPSARLRFKHFTKHCVDDENFPFDLMSITAIGYNLRIRGIDTHDLDEAINSSQRVVSEIEKMFNEKN